MSARPAQPQYYRQIQRQHSNYVHGLHNYFQTHRQARDLSYDVAPSPIPQNRDRYMATLTVASARPQSFVGYGTGVQAAKEDAARQAIQTLRIQV